MNRWVRIRAWFRGDQPTARRPTRPSVPLVPLADRGDPVCRNCLHFRTDAATFDSASAGPESLARDAVRTGDGLCLKHDRFVTPESACKFFRARLVRMGTPDTAG